MEDDVIEARGTKRTCQNSQCGLRFYDLSRDPMICPNCDTPYVIASAPPRRDAAAEKAKEVKAVEKTEEKPEDDADVELVSLEDAEVDVDDDDADDDTFLEDDDDDDPADVAVTVPTDDEDT